jgi:hypothetical protein
VARNGDNLVTHFQCDLCVFRNLTMRDPMANKLGDDLLMCCIRRANLDACWSRERSTVSATRRGVMTCVEHGRATGMTELFPRMGPMPVKDVTGHRVVIYILLDSLKEGKDHKDHKQFDLIRKLRAAFRKVWGASMEEASMSFYLGIDDKKKQTISSCPTLSDWFS